MRISDWSSDVCASDLPQKLAARSLTVDEVIAAVREQNVQVAAGSIGAPPLKNNPAFQMAIDAGGRLQTEQQFGDIIIKTGADGEEIGRASCRARVCQYV